MNIDPGLAVVILAVLIFYLRLIILQRERVKRSSQTPVATGKSKKAKPPPSTPAPRYSILSENRRARAIGLAGAVAILLGVVINAQLIPWLTSEPYWWILTAIGIIAFSWAFK